jgi:hypothetical protein
MLPIVIGVETSSIITGTSARSFFVLCALPQFTHNTKHPNGTVTKKSISSKGTPPIRGPNVKAELKVQKIPVTAISHTINVKAVDSIATRAGTNTGLRMFGTNSKDSIGPRATIILNIRYSLFIQVVLYFLTYYEVTNFAGCKEKS